MYPLKVSSHVIVPSKYFSNNGKFTMSLSPTSLEPWAVSYVCNFRVHPVAKEDQASVNRSFQFIERIEIPAE
jgi:hypothetical protein